MPLEAKCDAPGCPCVTEPLKVRPEGGRFVLPPGWSYAPAKPVGRNCIEPVEILIACGEKCLLQIQANKERDEAARTSGRLSSAPPKGGKR